MAWVAGDFSMHKGKRRGGTASAKHAPSGPRADPTRHGAPPAAPGPASFAAMNEEVSQYIAAAPAGQREILEVLRQLLREAVPEAQEEFKWSRPVYRTRTDFAYFKTAKAY